MYEKSDSESVEDLSSTHWCDPVRLLEQFPLGTRHCHMAMSNLLWLFKQHLIPINSTSLLLSVSFSLHFSQCFSRQNSILRIWQLDSLLGTLIVDGKWIEWSFLKWIFNGIWSTEKCKQNSFLLLKLWDQKREAVKAQNRSEFWLEQKAAVCCPCMCNCSDVQDFFHLSVQLKNSKLSSNSPCLLKFLAQLKKQEWGNKICHRLQTWNVQCHSGHGKGATKKLLQIWQFLGDASWEHFHPFRSSLLSSHRRGFHRTTESSFLVLVLTCRSRAMTLP